jgi:hypothetical protein
MSKLSSSHPFNGIGKDPIWPYDHLTLPMNFEIAENYDTEHVVFDIAHIDLPFNAIIGRPTLY